MPGNTNFPAQYLNAALTAACELLIDDFGLEPDAIADIAKDIPGECEAILQNRAEATWERMQESLTESGGPDDSTYRKQMKDAGRGHLLR